MKIDIHPTLSNDIAKFGFKSSELKTNFYDMKSGYPSDFFGRDVKNSNSDIIHHVHLIPDEDDSKRKS